MRQVKRKEEKTNRRTAEGDEKSLGEKRTPTHSTLYYKIHEIGIAVRVFRQIHLVYR